MHTLEPGHVALRRAAGQRRARREHVGDARPGDRREDRPGDHAAVAGSLPRRPPCSWPPGVAAPGCYYSSTLSFRNEHSPLPMEYNPRKVFLQLFGEGDTAAEREAIAAPDGQHAGPDLRSHQGAAEGAGPGDKAVLDRLPGDRARDRAPPGESQGARPVASQAAGGAGRRAGVVRRAGEADVRPDRAGVPGEPDARGFLHHGGRGHEPHLQPHRRAGFFPSAVASRE